MHSHANHFETVRTGLKILRRSLEARNYHVATDRHRGRVGQFGGNLVGSSKRKFHAGYAGTLLTLAACIAFLSRPTLAQTSYGSIVGTVIDASGGTIPGAPVTLTNNRTGDRRVAQSNSDGAYEFPNLLPGSYRVDVEKTGFKHLTRDNIEVLVQATVRVDAAMQIGDVGQTVEVSAQASLLQTDTSTLGTVVE